MADPLTPRGGFRHRFFARMKSLRSLRRRDSDETSNGFGQTPGSEFYILKGNVSVGVADFCQ